METAATQRSIDAVWRAESPKVIAALVRMVRDLDLAEELAQDALVTALERWPASGVPDNPGAWLMAAAKTRDVAMMCAILGLACVFGFLSSCASL